jgi:hypothetical protein
MSTAVITRIPSVNPIYNMQGTFQKATENAVLTKSVFTCVAEATYTAAFANACIPLPLADNLHSLTMQAFFS